jgi:hypothetical protein
MSTNKSNPELPTIFLIKFSAWVRHTVDTKVSPFEEIDWNSLFGVSPSLIRSISPPVRCQSTTLTHGLSLKAPSLEWLSARRSRRASYSNTRYAESRYDSHPLISIITLLCHKQSILTESTNQTATICIQSFTKVRYLAKTNWKRRRGRIQA